MSLFSLGKFDLHSGRASDFFIDCDHLTDEEIDALTFQASKLVKFGSITFVPSTKGGIDNGARIAKGMAPYISTGPISTAPLLIVDDVLTTGRSMNEMKIKYPNAIGLVLFARGKLPDWVKAVFVMSDKA